MMVITAAVVTGAFQIYVATRIGINTFKMVNNTLKKTKQNKRNEKTTTIKG